jgi:hypothetical protein
MKSFDPLKKKGEVEVYYEDDMDNPPIGKVKFQLTVSLDALLKIDNDLIK